jgi:predicted nucleic acid-binding protein
MTWLVDTGPFVAYVDRTDSAHARVVASLEAFTGQLATTSAVITEVMYFLSDVDDGPIAFAELLSASNTRIAELTDPRRVLVASQMMHKYADTPMDYADATLVLLAEDLAASEILTLDRRGFSTYRTAKGKPFRLVLS